MSEALTMLETNFSFDADQAVAGSPLKSFSWGELRARLDAAQQLRGVLAAQASQAVIEAAGRFEVSSVRQAVKPVEAASEGKLGVNPDPSINSKDDCAIAVGKVTERVKPARGQE